MAFSCPDRNFPEISGFLRESTRTELFGTLRNPPSSSRSLPLLHDYDVKLLSFTFYGGREHKKTFFFSFSGFRYNPLQSTCENFPNIRQIIFNGIKALNKV